MNNTFTNNLIISISGASHAKEIKLTVKGLPKGIEIDAIEIEKALKYRLGDASISTPRRETTDYSITTGVDNNATNGEMLTIVVPNNDIEDKPYENPSIVRPGHADLTQLIKYNNEVDIRGGGISSGRMTTPLVILGCICANFLMKQNIICASRIKQIGQIKDATSFIPTAESLKSLDSSFPALQNADAMKNEIIKAKDNKDSIGGIVETYAIGLPIGLGEPFFNSFESTLSHLIYSIPGINGLEFGEGFNAANLNGSTYNDEPYFDNGNIKYSSNNVGGLNGGLTNGNYLSFKSSIRPASSIGKKQNTIDLKTKSNVELEIQGRHDSCFVHRALPVITAVTNIAILDQMLSINNPNTLEECRESIDLLDNKIMTLINERFKLTNKVGKIKRENNTPILNSNREQIILNKADNFEASSEIKEIYQRILTESKKQQSGYLLVAANVSYSYSKMIHNLLENNNYEMQEIKSLDKVIEEQAPIGLNVTNPFKKDAYRLCNSLDEYAIRTGIVNLMFKQANGYLGYNTDYIAFKNMLDYYKVNIKNKNVVILGNGSTATTIKQVLLDNQINSITNIVRTKKSDDEILFSEAPIDEKCDIIINATSYGVYPNIENECLVNLNHYPNTKVVIDVNYNPTSSSLVLQAKNKNIKTINGLYMLVENGRLSEEIWQNKQINISKTIDVCKQIEKDSLNIVIIGQTLSGKSTLGQILSKKLSKSLWDNDFELSKVNLDLKNSNDELAFRTNESLYLKKASIKQNTVIIPGAGAIENSNTMNLLKQNAIFIYLDAPLELIKDRSTKNNRPMLKDENTLVEIYNRRKPMYEKYADIIVRIENQTIDEIVKEIMVKLYEYYDHKWS